ncbi:Gfo/Idh/MocA family protein [Halomonas elongata]|uniref:GFO family oxidoreductase n=1 Tax=Halomonas elongata (strain ATCC 33173 / DSM 2581 / NBRC 15536 / NCIMB 2198 / 1H9) TaxID=768066 RepID=E1V5D3_HALED|nr:Gfo/Idh/MocA family oxidoreductase [Halomonas elongata]WPU45660.1 Gfo/Idh/MocA family oxidoreductase [Halomonas elongata DSM 2581]CBV43088.1 GFO family oxidoreductase [Halomonas elongata DSM 2581]
MTTAKRRVRMGMIGGGEGAFIGQVHRLAAALDGELELVCASFSRDPDNNARTGEACGLPERRLYPDWQSLIDGERQLADDERMDVLVVVTPNHLHVPISQAALEAGFHVFCEKPAATTLADARRLAATLDAGDCLYGLAHTYLGYPMVWQARRLVRDGELGRLRKIHVEYPQGWLGTRLEATGNKQAGWRTDPDIAGASGCMADIGTHAFGLAEFISGHHVSELCASLGVHNEQRRLDDDGDALFRTAEGASGTLTASQVCTGEENALKIRLYGDQGALEWRQMEPNTLVQRRLDEPMRVLRAGIDQPGLAPETLERLRLPGGHPEGYLEALANLYRDFACAIRRGERGAAVGVPGMTEGLRGMAFIEALLKSQASTAKWTPLDEQPRQDDAETTT